MTYFSTMSDRWLTVCHIIFWVISFAKVLHFQYWYIIILCFYCIIHLLKHLIITVSHFCQHISLCWLELTSSLRSRFLFLLQITISAQQRMVYSFVLSGFHFYSFVCSVFSHVPKKESLACTKASVRRLSDTLERLARSSAISAAPSLQFSTVLMLGLRRSFHSLSLFSSILLQCILPSKG